jgi:tetratricopeptide (TPR) repeat protein
MPALACPQCSKPIGDDARCAECAFDASLLLQVRQSARRLATVAARHAAKGQWQAAYDAAAESLRLARSDNDLAAFILLVAALAGAHGSVPSVPRPRAEALPSTAAPFLDEVLSTATRLRAMADNPEEAETLLRELDPRHALLPAPPPPTTPPPASPPASPKRAPSPLFALVAGAVLLVAGFGSGWYGRRAERLQAVAPPPPAAAQPAATPAPAPPSAAAPPLPDTLRADAYRRGRDASKRKQYKEALPYLEIAAKAPAGNWYSEDALFFLGKTYHRLGRREDAAAAYRRLEKEAPNSSYVPEVRVLLARLERGQGVER